MFCTNAVAGWKTPGPVQWEPGQNSCTLHVQAFSSGLQEYYLELLPSRCPPLLCLYCGLLIVWQDWQAPWQSWLKALRSEKWDRYRANTCLFAVSQSPTGCVLHWRRINGSIKTQHFFSDSTTLACKEPFTWLFLFLRPSTSDQKGKVLFLVGDDHIFVQPRASAKKKLQKKM